MKTPHRQKGTDAKVPILQPWIEVLSSTVKPQNKNAQMGHHCSELRKTGLQEHPVVHYWTSSCVQADWHTDPKTQHNPQRGKMLNAMNLSFFFHIFQLLQGVPKNKGEEGTKGNK